LTIDEGTNLINSTDRLAIGLLNHFDIPYVRRLRHGIDHMHYVLDIVAPGSSSYFAGVERSDAPMSYSGSLRPGEVAELAINKGNEQWITMGEASGGEMQGYLEGAFRRADAGTGRLIVQLQKARMLQSAN
jgi:hypothetical protein